MSLQGGSQIPAECRGIVARKAFSVKNGFRQIVLCSCVSAFRGFAIPARGGCKIAPRCQTVFVKVSKVNLGTGVSRLCPLLELVECFRQVPPHAAATEV